VKEALFARSIQEGSASFAAVGDPRRFLPVFVRDSPAAPVFVAITPEQARVLARLSLAPESRR
jgi:hypothetical protein